MALWRLIAEQTEIHNGICGSFSKLTSSENAWCASLGPNWGGDVSSHSFSSSYYIVVVARRRPNDIQMILLPLWYHMNIVYGVQNQASIVERRLIAIQMISYKRIQDTILISCLHLTHIMVCTSFWGECFFCEAIHHFRCSKIELSCAFLA